ncbi:class I SAM-dependent methyltransferase, partial [Sporomusa sp.]|uniref:class I SAM-dependent methyltransferase n=1 Tax=Sporomusa sp. TaxID=2078658 RepID=UPI002C661F54
MNNEKPISFDSYEKMAEYYFEFVDTKPFNADYERPATISLLPCVKGKRVLDAGCAAGWYSKWLLEQGADVTALDVSPNMIEMTMKRVANKAEVIRADLNEPLNFITDRSFDIVLSSLTLHYLKDWNLVMAEFARILKYSGYLVFSVHHPFMDFTYFN